MGAGLWKIVRGDAAERLARWTQFRDLTICKFTDAIRPTVQHYNVMMARLPPCVRDVVAWVVQNRRGGRTELQAKQ